MQFNKLESSDLFLQYEGICYIHVYDIYYMSTYALKENIHQLYISLIIIHVYNTFTYICIYIIIVYNTIPKI